MDAPLLLGIEIGGTKIQLGLGRGDGRLTALERRAVEPAHGASGILSRIPEILDSLLGRVGATREAIDAVGIGFGGPVDAARGIVTRSHQVPGWDEFPLADWARQTLGMSRVVIHNDADTAGLGECRFGAGVGLSPVLYITVGSGIGGGLIIDGQIYRAPGPGRWRSGTSGSSIGAPPTWTSSSSRTSPPAGRSTPRPAATPSRTAPAGATTGWSSSSPGATCPGSTRPSWPRPRGRAIARRASS